MAFRPSESNLPSRCVQLKLRAITTSRVPACLRFRDAGALFSNYRMLLIKCREYVLSFRLCDRRYNLRDDWQDVLLPCILAAWTRTAFPSCKSTMQYSFHHPDRTSFFFSNRLVRAAVLLLRGGAHPTLLVVGVGLINVAPYQAGQPATSLADTMSTSYSPDEPQRLPQSQDPFVAEYNRHCFDINTALGYWKHKEAQTLGAARGPPVRSSQASQIVTALTFSSGKGWSRCHNTNTS